jgi:hypothetical protein
MQAGPGAVSMTWRPWRIRLLALVAVSILGGAAAAVFHHGRGSSALVEPPAGSALQMGGPPQPSAMLGTFAASELVPGVYPPPAYGISDWSGLDQRLSRNLAQMLGDAARLAIAQGDPAAAWAHTEEAIEVMLAFQSPAALSDFADLPALPAGTCPLPPSAPPAPGDPTPPRMPPPPLRAVSLDELDTRPVAERVQAALSSGWYGAAMIGYLVLDPAAGPEPVPVPPVDPTVGRAYEGLLGLRRAQHAAATGDAGTAQALGGGALEALVDAAHGLLTATGSSTDPAALVRRFRALDGDPFRRDSLWGPITVDFVAGRLRDYLQEAAALAGPDPELEARRAEVTAALEGLLAARRRVGAQGVPWWTIGVAYSRMPP